MSSGESREPPRPAEVRVPITALPAPRRPSEQQPEDAGTGSGSGSSSGSPGREPPAELGSEEEEQVPYPALAPTAFFCLKQTTRPRSWCLRLGKEGIPSLNKFIPGIETWQDMRGREG
ncbi:hypothetical protein DUI87_05236 [Hirundo rustica rustica]|uniref:Uncharacterized protein n=1 Tax=Hirundo rustica rustica TaxID=333673 RepID=A0A3M0KW80_HIRRU|nr:hypothetical protein DUI87_05236 [Hirundo rustica rustica]